MCMYCIQHLKIKYRFAGGVYRVEGACPRFGFICDEPSHIILYRIIIESPRRVCQISNKISTRVCKIVYVCVRAHARADANWMIGNRVRSEIEFGWKHVPIKLYRDAKSFSPRNIDEKPAIMHFGKRIIINVIMTARERNRQ